MTPELRQSCVETTEARTAPLHDQIDGAIQDLLASCPDPAWLSADERRGIIARYADVLEVHRNLQNVRLFVGRLSGVKIVLMMAFFEGWITRFMPYLAELARRQGSTEHEYTDVHGVVDVVHTQELFRALDAEMALAPAPLPPATQLLEGVGLLRTLIEYIAHFSGGVGSDKLSGARTT